MLEAYTSCNVNRRNAIKAFVGLPVSGLALTLALSLQGCGESGIEGDWIATDYKEYENGYSLLSVPTMTVFSDGSFSIEFTKDQTCRRSWVAVSDNQYKLGDKIFTLSSSGKFLHCEEGSLKAVVAPLGTYGAYISSFQRK